MKIIIINLLIYKSLNTKGHDQPKTRADKSPKERVDHFTAFFFSNKFRFRASSSDLSLDTDRHRPWTRAKSESDLAFFTSFNFKSINNTATFNWVTA